MKTKKEARAAARKVIKEWNDKYEKVKIKDLVIVSDHEDAEITTQLRNQLSKLSGTFRIVFVIWPQCSQCVGFEKAEFDLMSEYNCVLDKYISKYRWMTSTRHNLKYPASNGWYAIYFKKWD